MRFLVASFLTVLFSSHGLAQEASSSPDSNKLPFKISPETTYITEPLTKEGRVDYGAALNQMMKKGVTPETNAAVYYWRAMGPQPDGLESEEFLENLKQELGIDPFSENGPYMVNFRPPQKAVDAGQDPFADYNAALGSPWKSDDYPSVKKWIDLNQEPLDIVLEGTRQPHYFRPIVKTANEELLLTTLLPDIQQMRELARLLSARAMLAIGEARFEDASSDLIALHRLARHVGQGATMIELLVGVAIDAVAREGDLQLINCETISVEQLKAHQKSLSELPTLAHCDRAMTSERMFNLDELQTIATGNPKSEQGKTFLSFAGLDASSTMGAILSEMFQHSIDWNVVFTGINDYHDSVGEALSLDSFAKRFETIKQLNQELQAEYQQANRPSALALSVLFSPQCRGNHIRLVLLSLLTPALEQVVVAQTRGNSNAPLTETAFAVAAYQKREGKLPDNLQQLIPADLAEIPLDPFTGQPVHYLVNNDAATIYCLGKNLQDDKGITQQENRNEYDIVVRIPKQEPVLAN
ncbi:MAG: hypothetical protein HUJ26_07490 [Planctomycetaceae bacterium]|nr:hypothetical protein [Planctomycetaceae bacterium]